MPAGLAMGSPARYSPEEGEADIHRQPAQAGRGSCRGLRVLRGPAGAAAHRLQRRLQAHLPRGGPPRRPGLPRPQEEPGSVAGPAAPDDAGRSVDPDADRTAEQARSRRRVSLVDGMARGNRGSRGAILSPAESPGVGVPVHRPQELELGRSRETAGRRQAGLARVRRSLCHSLLARPRRERIRGQRQEHGVGSREGAHPGGPSDHRRQSGTRAVPVPRSRGTPGGRRALGMHEGLRAADRRHRLPDPRRFALRAERSRIPPLPNGILLARSSGVSFSRSPQAVDSRLVQPFSPQAQSNA